MKEKCFFALLIIFFILILGACTNLQAKNDPMSILSTSNTTIEDNQESVSSQPTEVDTSGDVYEELALNDHHHIQANVQGEEYTNLESFALEPLPVTIEEVVKIFAPDDSGEGTVKSTEEGTFLISNKGNHFYISQHRVLFEKEDEAQRQKNDEIINLLNLYAQDNPKNSAQDLDFINRNDAIQLVEDLLKKVGVNLKPILRAYVSLPAQTIMDYQQDLLKRDQETEDKYYDPFGKAFVLDDLGIEDDACFLSFDFSYQGLPIYNGSPTVSYVDGVIPPYHPSLYVLITRQGLQIFDSQALFFVGQSEHAGNIITVEDAIDTYQQKYDLVIHPEEYEMRVSSIYLEYVPIEKENGTVLIPYWCFPIEMEFPSGWYTVSSERFNAFTGEDITYGG